MERVTANMSAKQVRMSVVALSAAVMAVVWAFVDKVLGGSVDAVIVSSVTALVMLVAQYWDIKLKSEGYDVVDPESGADG